MSKFLLLISLYTKIKIKEEKIDEFVNEEKGGSFMDASTQTAPGRKKRGGQGSRRRRLLAFQLMLTQRQGLPKSRLLCLAEKGARSPGKRRRSTTVLKEEKAEVKQEKDDENDEEKKEDGRSNIEEASAGGSSTNFTPRSFQSDVFTPSSQPFSQVLSTSLNSPSFTPSLHSPTSRIYSAARCLGPIAHICHNRHNRRWCIFP